MHQSFRGSLLVALSVLFVTSGTAYVILKTGAQSSDPRQACIDGCRSMACTADQTAEQCASMRASCESGCNNTTPTGTCGQQPNWPDCASFSCTSGNWTCTQMRSSASGGGSGTCSQPQPVWPDCAVIACAGGNWTCTEMRSSMPWTSPCSACANMSPGPARDQCYMVPPCGSGWTGSSAWSSSGTQGNCGPSPNWPDCAVTACANGTWTCTQMRSSTSGTGPCSACANMSPGPARDQCYMVPPCGASVTRPCAPGEQPVAGSCYLTGTSSMRNCTYPNAYAMTGNTYGLTPYQQFSVSCEGDYVNCRIPDGRIIPNAHGQLSLGAPSACESDSSSRGGWIASSWPGTTDLRDQWITNCVATRGLSRYQCVTECDRPGSSCPGSTGGGGALEGCMISCQSASQMEAQCRVNPPMEAVRGDMGYWCRHYRAGTCRQACEETNTTPITPQPPTPIASSARSQVPPTLPLPRPTQPPPTPPEPPGGPEVFQLIAKLEGQISKLEKQLDLYDEAMENQWEKIQSLKEQRASATVIKQATKKLSTLKKNRARLVKKLSRLEQQYQLLMQRLPAVY